MVCEAHSGAWSLIARKKLDIISNAIASTTGEAKAISSLRLAQRTSIAHRANARAILQRIACLSCAAHAETTCCDSAAWAELGFMQWQ